MKPAVDLVSGNELELAKLRIRTKNYSEERRLENARAARHAAFKEALAACKKVDAKIKSRCEVSVVKGIETKSP